MVVGPVISDDEDGLDGELVSESESECSSDSESDSDFEETDAQNDAST